MEVGGYLINGVYRSGYWVGLATQHHLHPHRSLPPGFDASTLTPNWLRPRYVLTSHSGQLITLISIHFNPEPTEPSRDISSSGLSSLGYVLLGLVRLG